MYSRKKSRYNLETSAVAQTADRSHGGTLNERAGSEATRTFTSHQHITKTGVRTYTLAHSGSGTSYTHNQTLSVHFVQTIKHSAAAVLADARGHTTKIYSIACPGARCRWQRPSFYAGESRGFRRQNHHQNAPIAASGSRRNCGPRIQCLYAALRRSNHSPRVLRGLSRP